MDFNPFGPAFKADPYPVYAELREHAPALSTSLNIWPISRYDDVSFVLRNHALFSSAAMGLGPLAAAGMGGRSIISSDPPDHTQLRNLVNRAFTPRMVAGLEPRIREITRDLIARVAPSGWMDLVDDLATPLPVTVIAEILGVETERQEDFKRWSNATIGSTGGPPAEDRAGDVAEFQAYFAEMVERRRREPREDLISALVRAEGAEDTLTNAEIISFAMLLLIAGNETTTNLIGNAMLALAAHPDELRKVTEDRTLIPSMVEEALRYDSPVQFLVRVATDDVEVGGTTIPKGAPVMPIYASGNRDDRKYPDAARFDVTRNPQGHLAFGVGIHFCLGAPLARLEARVAFEELLQLRRIERAGEAERIDSLFLRGLTHLPLAFEQAAAAGSAA